MKRVLDMNGVAYKRVSLQSAYIASVSVTFQVDLEEDDQSENITQLGMFLGDPERFSSFSDYNVMEDGRGVVDISVAGIVISIYNYIRYTIVTPCTVNVMVQGRCMLTISVATRFMGISVTAIMANTYMESIPRIKLIFFCISAETCMCSSADLGSSLQLCSGAAISPCNCMDSNCSV